MQTSTGRRISRGLAIAGAATMVSALTADAQGATHGSQQHQSPTRVDSTRPNATKARAVASPNARAGAPRRTSTVKPADSMLRRLQHQTTPPLSPALDTTPPTARSLAPTSTRDPAAASPTGHQHAHDAVPARTAQVNAASDGAHGAHAAAPGALVQAAPRASTEPTTTPPHTAHQMWGRELGRGWQLIGMAQVFPAVTAASPWREKTLRNASGVYATQPTIMANLASPGSRLVLRTTLNFEAWTQPDGELTYGGWGEGFVDSRHPHTLLHEAMLTLNLWDVAGGALSLSAGKGFAPYGTDDPMARPTLKFPTNHHLSQVLERWTANAAYLWHGWSLEAGAFGGAEPDGPYDFRNIESFADSWSARLTKRFGTGVGPAAAWEVSASHASIDEAHHGATATTRLYNTAARHAQAYDAADVYGLLEGSVSDPDRGRGHFSVLGEARVGLGAERRHAPYARVEYATRPEYERLGAPGTPDFFRYDHDAHEIGATRWLISTVGYGYAARTGPVSLRPFVELQHNAVSAERGGIDPRTLYGTRNFWSLSTGARVFFGGGPMRMGSYGALDPMTASMRPSAGGTAAEHGRHR